VICLKMMTDQNSAGLEVSLNERFPRRVKAISTLDLGKVQNITEDHTLIEKGKEHGYILLTRDTESIRHNKMPFKPCTHEGIIKVIGMPDDEEVLTRMRFLLFSGARYVRQIKNHFTHLRADGATIHKEHGEEILVLFKR
jgi:hypothetical protein